MSIELKNGQVWRAPWPVCFRAIAQWIDDDIWILLDAPARSADGGSCMMAHSDPEPPHGIFYRKEELLERLLRNKWVLTDEFVQCAGEPFCRHPADA